METNFKILFESAPGYFLVLDTDLRIVAASDTYLQATKTRREEITGRPIFEAFPDDPSQPNATGVSNIRASINRVIETKAADYMPIQKFDIRLPQEEGGGFVERYWKPAHHPAFDDKGELLYIIQSAEDITDSVRKSDELSESRLTVDHMEVEKHIRERFVATLSHDLKQPLAAAKMSVQTLSRANNDRVKAISLQGRIVDNINRAVRMIDNLLDANRITAGESLPLDFEDCNLNHLISETLEDLASIHGQRFQLRSHSTIHGVWSSESLVRVIENLCSNAVKYGSADEMVTVSIHSEDDLVTISVHNHGDVLPPEQLARVFDQFHRGPSNQVRGKKGWGLGLTLVKGIAEAHRGYVTVESSYDKGTTFMMKLPLDAR